MSNFEIAAIIRELESYGFRALPASRERKCPVGAASWSVYHAKPMSEEEIAAANGDAVCILLGKCSGNAEVLDFDDEDTWSSWRRAMQQSHPALLDKLVWERTRNGGRHVLYRCPVIQGSRKLAKRIVPVPGPGVHPTGYGKKTLDAKLQPDGTWAVEPVLIETKGEGGLIICAPTPGYEWESGIPLDAPTLSPEERGVLLSLSRSFSEVEIAETQDRQLKGKAPDFGSSPHAYDQFNQNASLQEVIDLLAQGGWAQNGENTGRLYFTRAGKDSGTSATLTKDAPHIFFVFTESDSHFAANSSITPFQLLVAYKHDNNRDAALEEIRDRGFKPNLDMLDEVEHDTIHRKHKAHSFREISGKKPKEIEWVIDGWLPKGDPCFFTGEGGVGKSQMMLQLFAHIACGRPIFGLNIPQPMPCLLVLCEDDDDEFHRRMDRIISHPAFALDKGDIKLIEKNLNWISMVGQDAVISRFDTTNAITAAPFMPELRGLLNDLGPGPKVFALDTVADVFGGNENDRGQVNQFVKNHVCGLCRDFDATGVLIGHPPKSGHQYSGSTAWNGAFRSRLFVEAHEQKSLQDTHRVLRLPKSNRGPAGQEITLAWNNGVYIKVDDVEITPPDEERNLDIVMGAVVSAWDSRNPLSLSNNGTNKLSALRLKGANGKKIDPEELKRLVNVLINEHVVENVKGSKHLNGLRPTGSERCSEFVKD